MAVQLWRRRELLGDGQQELHCITQQTMVTYSSAMRRSMPVMTMGSLHFSAHRNCKVLLLLLGHNADEHVLDNEGMTPLHHVAGNDDIEAARILLERNAEVNARDDGGFTPFLRASESGSADVLRLLFHNNADGHVHDNIGTTALHFAAIGGHPNIVRILLERGADVSTQNRTLLSASTNGHVGNSPSGWITIPMSTLTTGE